MNDYQIRERVSVINSVSILDIRFMKYLVELSWNGICQEKEMNGQKVFAGPKEWVEELDKYGIIGINDVQLIPMADEELNEEQKVQVANILMYKNLVDAFKIGMS